MVINNLRILTCSIALFVVLVRPVNAAILASSDFNLDSDGWTFPDPTAYSHEAAGGVADSGYIRYTNSRAVSNVPFMLAPDKFLGNWDALGVTGLEYRANIFATGTFVATGPYSVIISGPGGEARFFGPDPDPVTLWKLIEVPLEESLWTINSGEWEDIIEDVDEFIIDTAYYTNLTVFEITGIDDVFLFAEPRDSVPEPSVLWLVLLGMSFSYFVGAMSRLHDHSIRQYPSVRRGGGVFLPQQ